MKKEVIFGLLIVSIFLISGVGGCYKKGNEYNYNNSYDNQTQISKIYENTLRVFAENPYILSDDQTQISIVGGRAQAKSEWNGFEGQPKIKLAGRESLNIADKTTINSKGYSFTISPLSNCEKREDMQGDVRGWIINYCEFNITAIKEEPLIIFTKSFNLSLNFTLEAPIFYHSINGQRTSELQKFSRNDGYFFAARVIDGSVYGKPELTPEGYFVPGNKEYASLSLEIITSFGKGNVSLDQDSNKTIAIGPEQFEVSVTSFENSNVKLNILAQPIAPEAKAVILEYVQK